MQSIGLAQLFDDVIDGLGERLDVGGVDGREHADTELVATELAIGISVDDAVGPKRRSDLVSVNRVVDVDGADNVGTMRRVGDERGRPVPRLGPRVEDRR